MPLYLFLFLAYATTTHIAVTTFQVGYDFCFHLRFGRSPTKPSMAFPFFNIAIVGMLCIPKAPATVGFHLRLPCQTLLFLQVPWQAVQ